MIGRENLRTFGVDFPITHPHLIDVIHQFGDQIKRETGVAEGLNPALGRNDHLRVLDRVIEIIFFHVSGKIER